MSAHSLKARWIRGRIRWSDPEAYAVARNLASQRLTKDFSAADALMECAHMLRAGCSEESMVRLLDRRMPLHHRGCGECLFCNSRDWDAEIRKFLVYPLQPDAINRKCVGTARPFNRWECTLNDMGRRVLRVFAKLDAAFKGTP